MSIVLSAAIKTDIEARDLVLDFFNVDKDSPRRSVYWDGMYSSYKLQVDRDLSFRFILLDAR